VEYSPDFSGQVVREDVCGACLASVELTITGEDIVDGQVTIVGPDLDSGLSENQRWAMLIEVSGREMKPDFESVLERQIGTILRHSGRCSLKMILLLVCHGGRESRTVIHRVRCL